MAEVTGVLVVFSALSLVNAQTTITSNINDFECPEAFGYEPNLNAAGCESYWDCAYHVATLRQCPDGDQFDFHKRKCLRDPDVYCQQQLLEWGSRLQRGRDEADRKATTLFYPTSPGEVTQEVLTSSNSILPSLLGRQPVQPNPPENSVYPAQTGNGLQPNQIENGNALQSGQFANRQQANPLEPSQSGNEDFAQQSTSFPNRQQSNQTDDGNTAQPNQFGNTQQPSQFQPNQFGTGKVAEPRTIGNRHQTNELASVPVDEQLPRPVPFLANQLGSGPQTQTPSEPSEPEVSTEPSSLSRENRSPSDTPTAHTTLNTSAANKTENQSLRANVASAFGALFLPDPFGSPGQQANSGFQRRVQSQIQGENVNVTLPSQNAFFNAPQSEISNKKTDVTSPNLNENGTTVVPTVNGNAGQSQNERKERHAGSQDRNGQSQISSSRREFGALAQSDQPFFRSEDIPRTKNKNRQSLITPSQEELVAPIQNEQKITSTQNELGDPNQNKKDTNPNKNESGGSNQNGPDTNPDQNGSDGSNQNGSDGSNQNEPDTIPNQNEQETVPNQNKPATIPNQNEQDTIPNQKGTGGPNQNEKTTISSQSASNVPSENDQADNQNRRNDASDEVGFFTAAQGKLEPNTTIASPSSQASIPDGVASSARTQIPTSHPDQSTPGVIGNTYRNDDVYDDEYYGEDDNDEYEGETVWVIGHEGGDDYFSEDNDDDDDEGGEWDEE